jgi:inorganic pyrophosphatase
MELIYLENLNGTKNVVCSMVIEQTIEFRKRIKYIPEENKFYETEYDSLFYIRKFKYPYGWIKESGTPPEKHLDIILLSEESYKLGEVINVKIIGCFLRKDNDNKFIGIKPERSETDFIELHENEKEELFKLYPRIDKGEGWFGINIANRLLDEWKKV